MLSAFYSIKTLKYAEQPYDFNWNPQGFKIETGCDISAHLPMLELLASRCGHVTEFGTRTAYSTTAFLAGLLRSKTAERKLICYDIVRTQQVDELMSAIFVEENPPQFEFRLGSTVDPNLKIEKTDLLFIDTLHSYQQVKNELKQATQVNRYIVFHDTFTDWDESLDCGGVGIGPAITEFLELNTQWQMVYRVEFNHGLIVLEKLNES